MWLVVGVYVLATSKVTLGDLSGVELEDVDEWVDGSGKCVGVAGWLLEFYVLATSKVILGGYLSRGG